MRFCDNSPIKQGQMIRSVYELSARLCPVRKTFRMAVALGEALRRSKNSWRLTRHRIPERGGVPSV